MATTVETRLRGAWTVLLFGRLSALLVPLIGARRFAAVGNWLVSRVRVEYRVNGGPWQRMIYDMHEHVRFDSVEG